MRAFCRLEGCLFGLGLGLTMPKGGDTYSPPAGNVISNWRGTGTGGTSGLPDGWTATTVAGVTFSVVSRTPYRGGNIIEFQFVGTATGSGSLLVQPAANNVGVAAPGQVWREEVFAEPVGTPTPIGLVYRISWRSSSALVGVGGSLALNGTIPGAVLGLNSTAPASTEFLGPFFFAAITSGQVVNTRYKVFAPTLLRVS